MRRVVAVLGLIAACAVATPCVAQIATSIDQVQPRPSSAIISAAPAQIPRAGGDRTSMSQLPADAQERTQTRDGGLTAGATAPSSMETLAPQARNAGAVDADEIARLLDRGEAASIDAAAAIASGVNTQRVSTQDEEPAARRRSGVEPAVSPRS